MLPLIVRALLLVFAPIWVSLCAIGGRPWSAIWLLRSLFGIRGNCRIPRALEQCMKDAVMVGRTTWFLELGDWFTACPGRHTDLYTVVGTFRARHIGMGIFEYEDPYDWHDYDWTFVLNLFGQSIHISGADRFMVRMHNGVFTTRGYLDILNWKDYDYQAANERQRPTYKQDNYLLPNLATLLGFVRLLYSQARKRGVGLFQLYRLAKPCMEITRRAFLSKLFSAGMWRRSNGTPPWFNYRKWSDSLPKQPKGEEEEWLPF